jgi:aspartate/methionine/tyrosine aminotransferase
MKINEITATPSVALADDARKKELYGTKVIKLQTGDPDFDTHPLIKEAAYKALKDGYTHYSFSRGLPELRNVIAAEINKEIDGFLTENNVIITCGAVQAMQAVFAAILEKDEEVIVFEPNWPTVDSLITVNGGIPKKISFLTDIDSIIEQLNSTYSLKTKAIVLNSPNNPTGVVLKETPVNKIIEWAIGKKLYVICDEVYRYFQYEEYSTSASYLNHYDKYIFIDSFSKKFAMTGWRIGYIVTSIEVLNNIAKASQINITHVAPFIQYAANVALSDKTVSDYCFQMKTTYAERRTKIMTRLEELKMDYIKPFGAFYFFIRLSGNDDESFSKEVLNTMNVCVVPGSAYGNSGKGFIRITFATDINEVFEGLNRLKQMM